MARVRKGDKVLVTAGKDKTKTGEVVKVLPSENRAIVKGVNEAKKHQKPSMANQQGGIMTIDAPIHLSNLMPVCPSCGKAVRVGYTVVENKKLRVCQKCKEQF
jgi:large subunit ribosomal protein L24